ncbi:MAG: bifunctional oligoribonuclease/PAP phosphatase NrnA [Acidobacteriota bacterium]
MEAQKRIRTEFPPISKPQEFAALLRENSHQRHLIVLQDFPDPDALSCAWAHRFIAENFNIKCDIAYVGKISHQENRALVQLTGMQLLNPEDPLQPQNYSAFVLIDNQGTTVGLVNKLLDSGLKPLIIVDHHERQSLLTPVFLDLRRVGATATIYTDYLKAGLLTLDRSNIEHIRLATALMHGLRSDTGGLVRAGEADLRAAAFLAPYVDLSLLEDILNVKKTPKVMDVVKVALENRIIQQDYSISGVGYLRPEDRDAIPQAAEFLLSEENVHTVIVYGIVIDEETRREIVIGSLRTSKLTLDPDSFLKETLGSNELGKFYGGGRRGAGGFEIKIGFLSGHYDQSLMETKWRLFDQVIKRKFYTHLGLYTEELTVHS